MPEYHLRGREIARRASRASGVVLLLSLVLAIVSCAEGPAPGNPQTSAVNWHQQMAPAGQSGLVPGALAELVRYPEGISFQITTEGLIPGNAYTLWLVVIDDPQECEANPCRPDEVIELEKVNAQIRSAGGQVAGGSRGTFAGSLPVGPTGGWLPDRSLKSPLSAEVWLVLNDHGPALDDYMPDMIDTYRGGCSDESPFPAIFPDAALRNGVPGPNFCFLFQVAVFLTP
jgi:hypothetical protein